MKAKEQRNIHTNAIREELLAQARSLWPGVSDSQLLWGALRYCTEHMQHRRLIGLSDDLDLGGAAAGASGATAARD